MAVLALLVVMVGGTLGYALMGFSLLDAVYQTVTTVATVGFREVQPFSAAEKIFTVVLVLVGVSVTLYTFTVVMEMVLEGHLGTLVGRRRMDRKIAELRGHVVLCGWGRVGKAIARELEASGKPLVVVDRDGARLVGTQHPTVVGDATSDATLQAAGIDRADALVCALASDAENLFVTISGRALRRDLFIVARAREQESVEKLRRGGADRVVNPQELGGARMAAFVVQPHVAEFIDVVMHERKLELRLEEFTVGAQSRIDINTFINRTLAGPLGMQLLAVRHADGRFAMGDELANLVPGDVLIVIGTDDALSHFSRVTSE